MWDNRSNKKNPKAPDFKCKDPNCKDGKYVTAVWEKDLPKKETSAPKPAPKPTNGRDPKWTLLNTCLLTAKDLSKDKDEIINNTCILYNSALDIMAGNYNVKDQIKQEFNGEEVENLDDSSGTGKFNNAI